MDLQEILKKQKERGFKKPLTASNTLSISDYLSDPNASRPYIDEISTPVTLSVVKNKTEITRSEKINTQQETVKTTQPLGVKSHVDLENNSATVVIKTKPIEIINIKQSEISDTKAAQKLLSAAQELAPKAAQEFRKAAQSAAQKLKNNHSKAGRPKFAAFDYISLVGNELNIINEIYSECLKSKSFETGFIEKNEFSQRVKVKLGAIRNSCRRLRGKGILEDFITTKGRGSAWKFVLSENIYHQISVKNNFRAIPISGTISSTKILSSSSDINNTTTQLPADWKKIDYVELQKTLNIFSERFGLAQIKTVFTEAGDLITAEDVQTSIRNFTIGLNNYIQKPSSGIYDRKVKIATLLECLKNGEIFIDPKVEALREAEVKRKAIEQRKEMAAQFFEPKFEYYFASLSEEQVIALIPDVWKTANTAWEYVIKTGNKHLQLSYARDFAKQYFEKNIWPGILEVLLA